MKKILTFLMILIVPILGISQDRPKRTSENVTVIVIPKSQKIQEPVKKEESIINKIECFLDDWLGTKYTYGGTTKKSGIDCSAFTREMVKFIYGIELPRTAKSQYNEVNKVKKDSVKTGDILFFKSKSSPSGWHVGVYLYDGKFVHSANHKEGVIISDLKSRSLYGVGRVDTISNNIKNKK